MNIEFYILIGIIIFFFVIVWIFVYHKKAGVNDGVLNTENKDEYLKELDTWLEKNNELSLQNLPFTISPLKGDYITLSAKEQEVDKHLSVILSEYLAQFKGIVANKILPVRTYFPKVKKEYENNLVFKFLDKMPKGGLLHIHSGAVGNLDWILSIGFYTPTSDWYINASIFNNPNPYYVDPNNPILFLYSTSAVDGSIWLHLTPEFVMSNKEHLLELLTMTEKLAGQDSSVAWEAFELINNRYGDLRSNPDYTLAFYVNGIQTLAKNGIQHIDIRLGFSTATNAIGKIKVFLQALEIVQRSYPNFTIKFILSAPRIQSVEAITSNLEEAYKAKVQMPNDVKGYDLIAQEDPNYPTSFYLDVWMTVPKLEEKYGVKLDYYFHDGESDWIQNINVVDAVLLNSRRIGHGFNTIFFPYILEEIKKKDICMEVCPISNQVLQYFLDLRMHPANNFFHSGVPMTICSDDPLMFGYNGLTYDFYAATVSWGLDLKSLKKLVYNSILYSCLSKEERDVAISNLEVSWNTWINSM